MMPMLTGYGCPRAQKEVASGDDEIVIDAHVVEALNISLGDIVEIGAGSDSAEFEVVGIGYHPSCLHGARGLTFPPEPGQPCGVPDSGWPV